MRNILFLWVLLPLLVSACQQAIFGSSPKAPELSSLLKLPPLMANQHFAIHQLPPSYNGEQILTQMTQISQVIRSWLNITQPTQPTKVLIFAPTDPAGEYFLHRSKTRHQSTGSYSSNKRTLLIIGSVESARFLTVLRHEAAHAALHDALPPSIKIPFWLNEGIASFFEQGKTSLLMPKSNNERLSLLRYLLADGNKLNIKGLIDYPMPKKTDGELYARSWGLVSCLYYNKHPIKDYLQALLLQSGFSPAQTFQKYLLKPSKSIEAFEASCTHWLLASNGL